MDLILEATSKVTEQILVKFTRNDLARIKRVQSRYKIKSKSETIRTLVRAAFKEIEGNN